MIPRVPALRRHADVVLLVVPGAASALVRFAAARRFEIPWISPDEEIYVLLGRSFWTDGSFSILGASAPYYSFLYPVLAGGPLAVFGVEHGLDALQFVQAIVMSS